MINEKDNNEIHEKTTINYIIEQSPNIEDLYESNNDVREKFESNIKNPEIYCNQNQTINDLNVEIECSNINADLEKKKNFFNNAVQEEKSSIFNSKNLVNKSVFEQFFEQNNFLYLSNVYEENIHSSEDLQNNINLEDKIDNPVKSSSKISILLNRNSIEKQVKRKKNMNIIKKELIEPLTHSIFEKNDTIEDVPLIIEVSKFPYKPINKEKEEKIEKYCEHISKQINNKNSIKKLVKINEREIEAQNLHVNTLLNEYTKGFFYSNTHSDIIQSSLEYNNYLINQLIQSKQKLPKSEYEHGLIILWENLKKLSKNAETHLKFFQLRNETKYNDLYKHYTRDVETVKNENLLEKSSISSQSLENSDEKLKKKRKRIQEKKIDEFTIIIDKSILKE